MVKSAQVNINGDSYELPIVEGSEHELAVE